MKIERKIALVARQVKVQDEGKLDVAFWRNKTPAERLSEVFRLRQNYFKWADGNFPQKIEKVVHQRKA